MRDKSTTIDELKQKIQAFRSARDWQNEDPKDIALSLILEASELLEVFQWKTGEEVKSESRLYGAICDELADVVWWVLVMTDRLGVDLSQALEKKIAKNEVKYPVSLFGKHRSEAEKWRAYYRVKARTRGGHPLAEDDE